MADLWAEAWDHLEAGAARADAPARALVLATEAAAGGAAARLVILRESDRAAGALRFHTDSASQKIAEISAEPRVTLLAWIAPARLQIRLTGRAAMRAGLDAEWAQVPDRARLAYGGTPPPGHPIPSSQAHDSRPDRSRFAVVTVRVDSADILRLDPAGHRRACFDLADGFTGAWVAP